MSALGSIAKKAGSGLGSIATAPIKAGTNIASRAIQANVVDPLKIMSPSNLVQLGLQSTGLNLLTDQMNFSKKRKQPDTQETPKKETPVKDELPEIPDNKPELVDIKDALEPIRESNQLIATTSEYMFDMLDSIDTRMKDSLTEELLLRIDDKLDGMNSNEFLEKIDGNLSEIVKLEKIKETEGDLARFQKIEDDRERVKDVQQQNINVVKDEKPVNQQNMFEKLMSYLGIATGGAFLSKFNPVRLLKAFTAPVLAALKTVLSPKLLFKALTKFALPVMIIGSVVNGLVDGFKEWKESGDLSQAIVAGMGGILDFLTFGLVGKEELQSAFDKVSTTVTDKIIKPVTEFFGEIVDLYDNITEGIKGVTAKVIDFVADAMDKLNVFEIDAISRQSNALREKAKTFRKSEDETITIKTNSEKVNTENNVTNNITNDQVSSRISKAFDTKFTKVLGIEENRRKAIAEYKARVMRVQQEKLAPDFKADLIDNIREEIELKYKIQDGLFSKNVIPEGKKMINNVSSNIKQFEKNSVNQPSQNNINIIDNKKIDNSNSTNVSGGSGQNNRGKNNPASTTHPYKTGWEKGSKYSENY